MRLIFTAVGFICSYILLCKYVVKPWFAARPHLSSNLCGLVELILFFGLLYLASCGGGVSETLRVNELDF